MNLHPCTHPGRSRSVGPWFTSATHAFFGPGILVYVCPRRRFGVLVHGHAGCLAGDRWLLGRKRRGSWGLWSSPAMTLGRCKTKCGAIGVVFAEVSTEIFCFALADQWQHGSGCDRLRVSEGLSGVLCSCHTGTTSTVSAMFFAFIPALDEQSHTDRSRGTVFELRNSSHPPLPAPPLSVSLGARRREGSV